jgi:hypothetical protein
MTENKTLAALLVAIACSTTASVNADPRTDEARMIVKEFAGALQGELKAAMKSGGPVQAVDVCHSRAPAIAAELASEHGWQVGRTSLKRRNPGNEPDAWETAVMEKFEMRKAAGEPASQLEFTESLVVDGKEQFRYMKAIPTQAICLTCHGGDNVAPEVAAAIERYYPDDRARGFSEGDLRGAFTLVKGR